MIVDSMTHEEVYQELSRDRESISNWWHHKLVAQRRRVLKSTKFPLALWFEHVSPRHNRYLFFTRIFDKRMKVILTGIAAIHNGADGLTAYTTWLNKQKLISPMVLTPHMWKQYARRCGVNKTGIELIQHYFNRNPHGADSDNQKVVGRSVRYNGEDHLSCCVNEGILLGQQYGSTFVARTFITYDMTTGLQKEVFGEKRKEILTDIEMHAQAKIYYNY